MDTATQTMIENLQKKSGKSLEEWTKLVLDQKLEKHGQIIKFLKENHGFSHGFANLVAHNILKSDAGSAENQDELIQKQYEGKEKFWPIYLKLLEEIEIFGNDIHFLPKKSYVSVIRKKQFAMLTPASKSRFEIGIQLKGIEAIGILTAETKSNAMCSHKIIISHESEITDEVITWLRKAYESAG